MKKKGFTLVEFLCLIAVIAILGAMILPALERAKRRADRIKTTAHIEVQSGTIVELLNRFAAHSGAQPEDSPTLIYSSLIQGKEIGGDAFPMDPIQVCLVPKRLVYAQSPYVIGGTSFRHATIRDLLSYGLGATNLPKDVFIVALGSYVLSTTGTNEPAIRLYPVISFFDGRSSFVLKASEKLPDGALCAIVKNE